MNGIWKHPIDIREKISYFNPTSTLREVGIPTTLQSRGHNAIKDSYGVLAFHDSAEEEREVAGLPGHRVGNDHYLPGRAARSSG